MNHVSPDPQPRGIDKLIQRYRDFAYKRQPVISVTRDSLWLESFNYWYSQREPKQAEGMSAYRFFWVACVVSPLLYLYNSAMQPFRAGSYALRLLLCGVQRGLLKRLNWPTRVGYCAVIVVSFGMMGTVLSDYGLAPYMSYGYRELVVIGIELVSGVTAMCWLCALQVGWATYSNSITAMDDLHKADFYTWLNDPQNQYALAVFVRNMYRGEPVGPRDADTLYNMLGRDRVTQLLLHWHRHPDLPKRPVREPFVRFKLDELRAAGGQAMLCKVLPRIHVIK